MLRDAIFLRFSTSHRVIELPAEKANQRIFEVIVSTRSEDGAVHLAPMGIWHVAQHCVLAPFRPSSTLENVLRSGCAVVNYTDQVGIFAGCLTGRRDWPVEPAIAVDGFLLRDRLSHIELQHEHTVEHELRPELHCRIVHSANAAPFQGFNRAQQAVLELAILVSRLHMLPREKIEREIDYLQIAIDKTAGAVEREAWGWLMDRVEAFRGCAGTSCAAARDKG